MKSCKENYIRKNYLIIFVGKKWVKNKEDIMMSHFASEITEHTTTLNYIQTLATYSV